MAHIPGMIRAMAAVPRVHLADPQANAQEILALLRQADEQRAELERWISATEFNREQKIAAVTRLYNEIGIDKLAQEKINHYFEESRKYLAALNVAEERKAELAAYAQRMMKRNY
mgnify:CR=1 FL=1